MDEVIHPGHQGELFPNPVPSLPWRPRPNHAGRRTSDKKLFGQVFTPLTIAQKILAMVEWPEGASRGILLDPACGDGVFLEAAVRKVLGMELPRDEVVSILEHRIVGWDLDEAQVTACRNRLQRLLERVGLSGIRFHLERRDALAASADIPATCVVGNPPYLEAKRMPDELKRTIRASFPEAADGGFDLFGAFVALALRLTRGGGEIGLVIPNRFLTGTYAARLRRRLSQEYVTEVQDLSTERVFPDAAVYPVILHARRRGSDHDLAVLVRGSGKRSSDPTRGLAWATTDLWPVTPADPRGTRVIQRIMNDPFLARLEEVAAVRWTVSFHRSGWRDLFVTPEAPRGARHPRRFLGGGRFHGNREILPFRIRWDGWWIDYDEERAKRVGNPLPPLSLFEQPKVVVCQNARRLRAAVDRDGFVLKDTFMAVVPRKSPECAGARPDGQERLFHPPSATDTARATPSLEWLCIVLHSDLMHYLYEHLFAGTRKGGGYLQYLPRFLSVLPVARCPDEEAAVRLAARLSAGEPVWKEAEALVLEAFQVTRLERRVLTDFPFPRHPED